MEQHRTRPPQPRTRRGTPLPPQTGRGGSAAGRPGRTPSAGRGTAVPRGAAGAPRGGNGVQRSAPGARRPVSPLVHAVRRMPNPRLTGLGSGLFCGALMFALACLDQLLFGASLTVYGVLFLPVCAVTAVWVRRGDLVTAPVVVPIAFAFGLLPVADGGGGFGGHVMGLVTALATQAGWLYGGTLVAGLIATVRKARQMTRRAARRRPHAPRATTAPARRRPTA
ncbi:MULTISPECIES: DUF6542 domain-containing protein [unclassified Streptomyces]|uniref:DUF6542 domain-containing protein n=1 Tax=unclassified Streptomyces TaxID=2593676 RepID=UPI0033AAECC2